MDGKIKVTDDKYTYPEVGRLCWMEALSNQATVTSSTVNKEWVYSTAQ